MDLNEDFVQEVVLEALRRGPMDFLELADCVAPRCDVTLRQAERVIRNLLQRRMLTRDAEFRILATRSLNGKANGHKAKTNGRKTNRVAAGASRKAKTPPRRRGPAARISA